MKARILIAAIIGLGLPTGAYGCGGTQTPMVASNLVPAAEGEIEAKRGDHGNTELTVTVRHLAQPEKLSDGATTYVVWIKPPGELKQQNIGALAVDKNLTGTLKTTTPHDEFELSITAESFPQAAAPSGPEVLSTTVREE
jgi:hypothetical protein